MAASEAAHPYCDTCDRQFSAQRAYVRHLRTKPPHVNAKNYHCSSCSKAFSRKDTLDRHQRRRHALDIVHELGPVAVVPAKRTFSQFEEQEIDSGQHDAERMIDIGEAEFDFDLVDDLLIDHEGSPPETEGEYWVTEAVEHLKSTETSQDFVAEQNPNSERPIDHGSQNSITTNAFSSDYLHCRQDSAEEVPGLIRSDSLSSSSQFGPDQELGFQGNNHNHSGVGRALDVPFINYSLPFQRQHVPKRISIALRKFGNTCYICGSAYGSGIEELLKHLNAHLAETRKRNVCKKCNVAFERKADFDHHIRSVASIGECGFDFAHAEACTGHHGPLPQAMRSALTDHDRFKFGILVRGWEHTQLHVHQANIQRLAEAKEKAEFLGRFSIPEGVLQQRNSLASLVYSLKSFKSEDYANAWDEDKALNDVSRKLGKLNIRAPLHLYRRKRQKNIELQLANAAIGPAAFRGDDAAIKLYLAQGANVDSLSKQADKYDVTPLMLAAEAGHDDIVRLLIEHGAGVNITDSRGLTPLHKACKNGRVHTVQLLIESGAAVVTADSRGQVAVVTAVLGNHAEVARTLLHESALAGHFEKWHRSAMLHLAVEKNLLETAQVLLECGADPNSKMSNISWRLSSTLADGLFLDLPSGATTLDKAILLDNCEMAAKLQAAGGIRETSNSCQNETSRETFALFLHEKANAVIGGTGPDQIRSCILQNGEFS